MKTFVLSLMSVTFMLAGAAAKADTLTLTLFSPYQNSGAGNALTFDATVTNNSSETVYLNGDSPSVAQPLTVDDSPYNNNFPLTLAAGNSFTGELFDLDIPNGTPLGLYTGAFEITGGFGSSDQNVLGAANFNVNVTPEPPSFVLLATGLMCGLAGIQMHRRRLMA